MKLLVFKLFLTGLVSVALLTPFFYPSLGSGILAELAWFGLPGSIVIALVFLFLVFLYCRDLSTTLDLIAPQNRCAAPASVWFMFLIPYNFVEDFFIIHNVAKSIATESKVNAALRDMRYVGYYTGIGWCSAQIVSLAPGMIGKTASLFAIVLWIAHWRFIRKTNHLLQGANGRIF